MWFTLKCRRLYKLPFKHPYRELQTARCITFLLDLVTIPLLEVILVVVGAATIMRRKLEDLAPSW